MVEMVKAAVLGACYDLFLGVPRTIKDIPRDNSQQVGCVPTHPRSSS